MRFKGAGGNTVVARRAWGGDRKRFGRQA